MKEKECLCGYTSIEIEAHQITCHEFWLSTNWAHRTCRERLNALKKFAERVKAGELRGAEARRVATLVLAETAPKKRYIR